MVAREIPGVSDLLCGLSDNQGLICECGEEKCVICRVSLEQSLEGLGVALRIGAAVLASGLSWPARDA